MQRLHALLSCTLVCLACDPQGDDPETLALADDSDEPGLAPDADVPLGADVKPQAVIPCKVYSGETDTYTKTDGCKSAGGPNFPPIFEEDLLDIGVATAVADCSSSGNAITGNGKARCTNVCNAEGKLWVTAVDNGTCLEDAEITATPVSWQAAPATCPAGFGKFTATVHAEAQCGCTCSP